MKPFVMKCDIACFKALGIDILKVGNCFISNTGALNPILNCVYNFNGNHKSTLVNTKKVLGMLKASGTPFSLWTEASSEPLRFRKLLNTYHKEFLGEFLGMGLNISEISEEPGHPDLAISMVETDEDFKEWGKIIAEAFHFNEFDAELYNSLFIKAGTNGPFYHLIGKKNGHIVSTGTILCSSEGAYLYNLATRASERRRGYASMMTNALLQIAKQKKQSRVALVSSIDAGSIYRKTGFQEFCRFHIYV